MRCVNMVEVASAALAHMGMLEGVKVAYNKPDHDRLAGEEHNETKHQSDTLKSTPEFRKHVHPAIAKAIHKFAIDKPSFHKALKKSSIEPVHTYVGNSEIGQGEKHIEDKDKVKRVKRLLKTGKVDRPIILRHKHHLHLLSGNTRATIIGPGVEAHHIDV